MHADLTSPEADFHDKAPILDSRQKKGSARLVCRRRPLVGGIKIAGAIAANGSAGGEAWPVSHRCCRNADSSQSLLPCKRLFVVARGRRDGP